MAVRVDLVGEGVLGQGHVVDLIAPAPSRSGDPLHRVDRQVRDQPRLGERRQGEDRGGRVAARVRDQVGVAEPVAVELRQAIDGV